MNTTVSANFWRFLIFTLVQIFILRQITTGWDEQEYMFIFIYPLAILLLPIRTSDVIAMILGFVMGMLIDIAYNSYGVHAAALVFTAYMRRWVLRYLEPRDGYAVNASPTIQALGQRRFFQYVIIMLFLHFFWYFATEAFTLYYFWNILLKTLVSAPVSFLLIAAYMTVLNPKE